MSSEVEVKGIIISTAPQGEYGRRIKMLTDKLGKITVFAAGAAKQGSKLMGAVRPMCCAGFRLMKGRTAYNLHGAEIIDAFDDIAFDFDRSMRAAYVLEAGDYFSEEGMSENEARSLLNLIYVTLAALRLGKLDYALILSVFELRLLVLQGEYTVEPPYSSVEDTVLIWHRSISARLSELYAADFFEGRDAEEFTEAAEKLFSKQVKHSFKALELLRRL